MRPVIVGRLLRFSHILTMWCEQTSTHTHTLAALWEKAHRQRDRSEDNKKGLLKRDFLLPRVFHHVGGACEEDAGRQSAMGVEVLSWHSWCHFITSQALFLIRCTNQTHIKE